MKEITPFLHAALYQRDGHYQRITTFEQLATALSPWILTKEHRQTWFSPMKVYDPPEVEEATTPVPTSSPPPTPQVQVYDPPAEAPSVSPVHEPQDVPPPTLSEIHPKPLAARQRPQPSRFSPRKPDSLFWSMFIAHHGVDAFRDIGSKYMNRELEEKAHIVEFLKNNRHLLKAMKITVAATQEMMGDLLTNKQTVLTMVPAFAMYYGATIRIVCEQSRTYLEYLSTNEASPGPVRLPEGQLPGLRCLPVRLPEGQLPELRCRPVYTLYRVKTGQRSYSDYEVGTEDHAIACTTAPPPFLKLESPTKPLRGISTYKTADLDALVKQLGIRLPLPSAGSKLKKNDVYVAISRHCESAWV